MISGYKNGPVANVDVDAAADADADNDADADVDQLGIENSLKSFLLF